MRLFDDRMFILDKKDPGTGSVALNQVFGTPKADPIMAFVGEFGAPALDILKVALSVFRSLFNLFMWRDPFLSSLFFFGAVFFLLILLVFPWRLFFFVVGLVAFGPQNWLLRVQGKLPLKKKETPFEDIENESKKNKIPNFQFHNHLTTDGGNDTRDKKFSKGAPVARRALVPNSPLISRRFYDWPPNPSVSKVDVYPE